MIAPFDELNDVEQLKTKAFKSPIEVRVIAFLCDYGCPTGAA